MLFYHQLLRQLRRLLRPQLQPRRQVTSRRRQRMRQQQQQQRRQQRRLFQERQLLPRYNPHRHNSPTTWEFYRSPLRRIHLRFPRTMARRMDLHQRPRRHPYTTDRMERAVEVLVTVGRPV